MRDVTLETQFYQYFSTRAFATGIPTTLAGSPVISAYEDNNVTQITAGVSLSVDFDGVTGLNLITVVATAANGFENGKSYALVITTGTVDSVSVVGEVVGEFTIGQSAAAVDLANGTDGLGAIKAETALIVADTNELQTDDIPGAIAGLNNFDPALDTVTVGTNNDKTGYALSAAGIQAIWDALTSALTTAGSVGKLLVDNINATISSRSSHAAAAVWAVATRLLTAATNITSDGGTIDQTQLAHLDADVSSRAPEAGGNVAAILEDTGTTIPTQISGLNNLSQAQAQTAATAALTAYDPPTKTEMDAVHAITDGLIAALNNISKAEVNAEMLDVLNVDTFAEPTGAPAATASLVKKLGYVYMALRNKLTVTASKKAFHDDAGNEEWSKALDDDGTTFTESEGV